MTVAGYSGTPLVQKLGFKPGHRLAFVAEPPEFAAALGPLPDGAELAGGSAKNLDAAKDALRRAKEAGIDSNRLTPLERESFQKLETEFN